MEFSDKERRVYRSLSMADLFWFTRWMFVNRRGYTWQQANHHKTVCEALMRVFRGECKRLIINIPPRYSKTEIVKNFVGWSLGQYPDCEFIYTSYSGRLAAASSWDVRGLVQEPEFQAIFPAVQLRDDSKAKDEWRTTAGGIVYAVGSEGTITGYGAGKLRPGFGGALLIDDPHKADEARSDTMRQNVIDWFQNTFESRKNSPETPIILIMQRLHESDLAGWLLNGGNGEKWEHVCLPALQDDGTALWPEKHSVAELRRMEAASPYTFAGQYQQRPAPAEGGIFKPDQIQVIDALPYGHIQWVRGWDLASTTDGDFTAGGKLGRLPDGRFVIGDMVRLRVGPDERDAAMVNTASQDGVSTKISIPQDPGQAGKTQVLYLTRELVGYSVTTSPESGDKVTRAEPFAAQVNVGNVVMLRGSWNAALIDEMRMFPNGTFDDQIDSLSRAFSHLIGGGLAQWAALAG
ncbi:putative phage terminase large subunit-like protein [Paraburkholderia tropica]|uniref:phage terminase large subunit n=1 Tax=Paraburkholderia tropica TaxID=92647 RepID=UPI0016092F18|nr:phage terminase large subunit [Paraburkholderia tropica]MBB3004374.1 putative phage terminase large subunit-like protein [Paraburkholderia tropica]